MPENDKLVAFLPWLRLSAPAVAGEITFLPYRVGSPSEGVLEVSSSLDTILSGYVDGYGNQLTDITLVTNTNRNPVWNLTEDDHALVGEMVDLLTVSALSECDYYCQLGSYCSTFAFHLVWQRFKGEAEGLAIETRRRDGSTLEYVGNHGTFKFSAPVQYARNHIVDFDKDFLAGLVNAATSPTNFYRRMRNALSFLKLANTDSDLVIPNAEIILMAAAFDQVVNGNGKFDTAKRFSMQWHAYTTVKVKDGLTGRPTIQIEDQYREAQLEWPLSRKWMEEIYDLRSFFVHGQDITSRDWAWHTLEHLVMAALVFPLFVKINLVTEHNYSMTEQDEQRCKAVDKLLSVTKWHAMVGTSSEHTRWRDILNWNERFARMGLEEIEL